MSIGVTRTIQPFDLSIVFTLTVMYFGYTCIVLSMLFTSNRYTIQLNIFEKLITFGGTH